jgi:acyl carrier protein
MCLEEEFNIEISDMEAGEIPTVGEAVNFIESRMVN